MILTSPFRTRRAFLSLQSPPSLSQPPPPYSRGAFDDPHRYSGQSGYNNGSIGYRAARVQPPAHPDPHHRDIQPQPLNVVIMVLTDFEFRGLGSKFLVQPFGFTSGLIIIVAELGLPLMMIGFRMDKRCGLSNWPTESGEGEAWESGGE